MLRAWIHSQVIDILPEDKFPNVKVMQAGTWGLTIPGVDTTPDPPFVLIRGGTYDPRGRQLGRSQRFQVWIHDRQGSYLTNIEPNLLLLANVLPTRAPAVHLGWNVTACEFEGTSEDLYDPDKQTAMRYGIFRITGRQVGSA